MSASIASESSCAGPIEEDRMPQVVSDIVDVYVFRRLNARVQFLLLQRKRDVALGQTWQSFHTRVQRNETTIEAAYRAVEELAGLRVSAVYSADYVNQFFDDTRDVLVLAPVLAVNVSPQAPVRLDSDLRDCAWLDRDEATVRLPFSGQRWAVRHIDEIMSIGHVESELYRLTVTQPPASGHGTATPAENRKAPAEGNGAVSGVDDAWTSASPERIEESGLDAHAEPTVAEFVSNATETDDDQDTQTTSSTIRANVRPPAE